MGSTCKVANYALSTRRYCKLGRRKELSGKKRFGACVLCKLRRNTNNNTSSKSRLLLHKPLTMTFLLLPLHSLPSVRIPGRIINLHNSTPRPRVPRCRTHSHTSASKHHPLRSLLHLALHLRAVQPLMSWISMIHLRWRSTRVSCFSQF